MMTSLQDYKFCEPKPPATAIDGEIIPTADIDNRHPTLRFEDWYYLKEMIHFLRGDMVFWNTLPNHSEWLGVDVDWNYLLEGCTPFYDPGRRDRYVYLKPDFPLVGLDSGVTQVQVSPTQLIKQNNWMSSISDLSQVIDNVSLHKQLDANDLRRIYWELNNTRNWYIRHSLDGVYEYHQTYRVGQGESGTTYQVDEWD